MRVLVDERLIGDIRRYALRFTCRDCVHFLPGTGTCAHEWPNQEHLALPAAGEFLFCKEFELL